jgi:hypothetical protein
MSSSTLPNQAIQHHRAASLSVARSPSILTSTSFNAAPASTPPDDHNSTSSPTFPLFLPASHAHTQAPHALTRTTSQPAHTRSKTKPALSDIPFEDEPPSIPLKRTVTFDHTNHVRRYDDGDDAEYDTESELTDERALDAGDDAEMAAGRAARYSGGFQKPDSKELMAIGLSIVGVTILSLAAGLTTVYDWVL